MQEFHRGKRKVTGTGDDSIKKYWGFTSQLGIGVIIPDSDKFVKAFANKSDELRESFRIKENLPFFFLART